MAIGSIMNKVCMELKNLPMKVFCVTLVILQSFFLDVIIIHCYGKGLSNASECEHCQSCYWWIAGDVVICILFIVSFAISFKHLKYHKRFKRVKKAHLTGGLPLSCATWFIYSAYVSAKVITIFKSGIDDRLDEKDFYGPQFLKTGICLSGVVFILFVAAHHHAKEDTKERMYINAMATGVTFDVLDTVDFLDILFVKETHVFLLYPLENAILAIAIVNLMRPTFSFLVLMLNHFGATKISRELTAANALVYIFLVNVPFMAIRMYLWHNLSQDISVFLIKNFVMIFIGINELCEIAQEKARERAPDGFEMTPRLTLPHRPSDLVDGQESSDEQEVPPTYGEVIEPDTTTVS